MPSPLATGATARPFDDPPEARAPRRPLLRALRGLTLVETLTCAAIVGIALACAVPSWATYREQRALDGQVAQVVADLQYARQASITAAEPVRFSVPAAGGGRCYVVHTGARDACACGADGAATCDADAQLLRLGTVGGDSGLQLRTRTASFLIDPTYGTVTPTGSLRVVDRHARDVQVIVNLAGRIRTCSVGPLPGYPTC